MALWYTIQIERLKVDGEHKELRPPMDRENTLKFYPRNISDKPYALEIFYLTGEIIKNKFLFWEYPSGKKSSISDKLKFEDVQIDVISPPEDERKIKNMGIGAVAGALVAGPIGAAAGGWAGTKLKNVDIKVTIPSMNVVFLGKVASGFLQALEKAKTSAVFLEDF